MGESLVERVRVAWPMHPLDLLGTGVAELQRAAGYAGEDLETGSGGRQPLRPFGVGVPRAMVFEAGVVDDQEALTHRVIIARG